MYRIFKSVVHCFLSLELKAFFAVSLVSISLLACDKNEYLPSLPEGKQTISGIVKPAELSLLRRGTHALYQDSEIHTYLESSLVNLRSYEGKYVVLSGLYEQNEDAILIPIFVVEALLEAEDTVQKHEIPSFNISFYAPVLWEKENAFSSVLLTSSGSANAIVSFSKETLNADAIPIGENIAIGGKPAIRQVDDLLNTQTVFIILDNEMLVITFNPDNSEDIEVLKAQWIELLQSIVFKSLPFLSSSSSVSETTVLDFSPCGGVAGILCPKGQYCEITDIQLDIGYCKNL